MSIYSVLAMYAEYITEFIGTFCFVLTYALNLGNVHEFSFLLAPFSSGCILMVMIYMGGHISGAHFNPAVTFGVFLRGSKVLFKDALIYIIVQCIAAILAALVGFSATTVTYSIDPPSSGREHVIWWLMCSEMFFSFCLVLVVLSVGTSRALEGNNFYGVAIGFTFVAGAISTGLYGTFNPALATGLLLVDLFSERPWGVVWLWVYWACPLLGATMAAFVYRVINFRELLEENSEEQSFAQVTPT